MNTDLLELESLVKRHSAVLRITVEPHAVRASWKMRGQSRETVIDRGHDVLDGHKYSGIRSVLHELLERLGYRHLATSRRAIDLMTEAQFARVCVLFNEYKQIRDTALGRVAHTEPVLASPRSSLHPQFCERDAESEDA